MLISDWLRKPNAHIRVYGGDETHPTNLVDELMYENVRRSVGRFATFEITPLWDASVEGPIRRDQIGSLPFPITLFEYEISAECGVRIGVLLYQPEPELELRGIVLRWVGKYENAPATMAMFELQSEPLDERGIAAVTVNLSGSVPEDQDHIDLVGEAVQPALYAMSLINCRNVIVEPEEDKRSRQERRNDERRGLTPPRRYRIIVKVPGKQRQSITGYGVSAQDRAAHMVRGHFSEYTAERPLFGKYTGRFWIPAHVRGKRDEGQDVKPKDYVVVPSDAAA